MTPAVRPARPEEREALGELLAGLLAHHGEHPRYATAPDAGSPAALLADYLEPGDGRVFVAERDGRLVGVISVALARRPAFFAETVRGHVEHLYVRPDARRRGLGRALVEEAFAWLRRGGASRVELEIDPDNLEGRRFWSALGFETAMQVLERPL